MTVNIYLMSIGKFLVIIWSISETSEQDRQLETGIRMDKYSALFMTCSKLRTFGFQCLVDMTRVEDIEFVVQQVQFFVFAWEVFRKNLIVVDQLGHQVRSDPWTHHEGRLNLPSLKQLRMVADLPERKTFC